MIEWINVGTDILKLVWKNKNRRSDLNNENQKKKESQPVL